MLVGSFNIGYSISFERLNPLGCLDSEQLVPPPPYAEEYDGIEQAQDPNKVNEGRLRCCCEEESREHQPREQEHPRRVFHPNRRTGATVVTKTIVIIRTKATRKALIAVSTAAGRAVRSSQAKGRPGAREIWRAGIDPADVAASVPA